MSEPEHPVFEHLSPDVIVESVESAFGLRLTGVLMPYSSYINRVYGLEDEDGDRYVVKFYRPNRWSTEAILEEHQMIRECAENEIPVVSPISSLDGRTLQSVTITDGGDDAVGDDDLGMTAEFEFALFPSRGGRLFDAENDEDWIRLGVLTSRLHVVGKKGPAPHRLRCTPSDTTTGYVEELRVAGVVHPDASEEFLELAGNIVREIEPLFEGVALQRIHGDCHRGNILHRPGEGLMLIDFDDMLTGPVVQDIWLLLPDYVDSSYRELELILEGYGQFNHFDRETIRLVEPLRFMRMIHYLAWSASQRNDHRFRESFPDWGSKAFWIKEIEDLRVQERVILNGS